MRNLFLVCTMAGAAFATSAVAQSAYNVGPSPIPYMAPNSSAPYSSDSYVYRPALRRAARRSAYGYAPATTYGSAYGYTPGSIDSQGIFHPWPGGSLPQYQGGPKQPW